MSKRVSRATASQAFSSASSRCACARIYRWELQENGRDVQADAHDAVIINDPLYAIDLALAGVGLVYVFEPLVRDHLKAKRLVEVMPEASIEEPGLFLYFPRRASLAPKLRAFIETARDVLEI